MPNRFIKESICTSETLAQLTAEEERFFYRLIVKCDDFGRFEARPRVLRASCFPLEIDSVSDESVEAWLQRLVDVGLVLIYEVGDRRYLQVVTWDKHQQRRAKHSKYPGPNDGKVIQMSSLDNNGYQALSDVSTCSDITNTNSRTNTKTTDEQRGLDIPEPLVESAATAEESEEKPVGLSVESVEEEFKQVVEAYRKHIGIMGPKQYEALRVWLGDPELNMPGTLVVRAIEIAAERDNRRMEYVDGILRNWHNDGVRTIADLSRRESGRNGRSRASPQPGNGAPNSDAYSELPDVAERVRIMRETYRGG